jgi:hypothetical protein
MKQRLFFMLMLVTLFVATASAQTGETLVIRAGSVEHVFIENDLDVVLMPAGEQDQNFQLDGTTASKLDVKLSGHSMTVAPVRRSVKGKLTVHLYVNNLKSVTAGSNTNVNTVGVLKTPSLDVYVDGGSTVHLRTNGKVNAFALFDGNVNVKDVSGNWLAGR